MGISLETPRGAVKDNAPRKFGRSGVSEHDQVVLYRCPLHSWSS